jgi:hypothetical protein
VNGNQSVQHILSLQLKVDKEGSYTIGPAHIQISSGVIDSNIISLSVSPSITSLQEQLKGPRNIDPPSLPWKYIAILIAGIFGLYIFWRRYIQVKEVEAKHSIIEDIHSRPTPDLGNIDWISKIP